MKSGNPARISIPIHGNQPLKLGIQHHFMKLAGLSDSDLGVLSWRIDMDDDLEPMSREQLVDEIKRLRQGIREHRDSSLQELCWHHPALWGLLPEKTDPLPVVPEWPEFMQGCVRYRQSLDEQAAHAPRSKDPYQD